VIVRGSYFATTSVEKLDQESGRWLRETDAVAVPTLARLRRELVELLAPDDSVEGDEKLLGELGEQQYWQPSE
jgi:hypothetical protein